MQSVEWDEGVRSGLENGGSIGVMFRWRGVGDVYGCEWGVGV